MQRAERSRDDLTAPRQRFFRVMRTRPKGRCSTRSWATGGRSDPDPQKSKRVMEAILQMKKLDIARLEAADHKK